MNSLAIDIGSSSVRAIIYDGELRPLAQARQLYQLTTEPPGASFVSAHMLRHLTERCIDDVLAQTDIPIDAVGMATFVGNLLGVDADGSPLTPIYSYADMRCADELTGLANEIDTAAAYARTGCPHHSAYHPAKLRWLARQEVQPARWLDIGTYLYSAWFGRAVPSSYSVASWSGLLQRERLSWDDEWLRVLRVRLEQLPALADVNIIQRGLSAAYAQRWSRLRDAPFLLAVGDGAAANVGSGAVGEHTLALTVGTTTALRKLTTLDLNPFAAVSGRGTVTHSVDNFHSDTEMLNASLPPVPAGLWGYRLNADHHLMGGALTEGGNVVRWLREVLALPADWEMKLAAREADAHGLTVLPLLGGERSPGYRANATGTLHGIRLHTNALDIAQALLESVALRVALIGERLIGAESPIIYAGGGSLLALPLWAQVFADALHCPLHLLAEDEPTARGVALLVRHTLDSTPLQSPPATARVIEPRAEAVERLRAARERQAALYEKLGEKS